MTEQPTPYDGGSDPAATGPLDEATAYAQLSRVVVAERPLGETLDEIASLARRTLPQRPEVSVTLVEGESARTAAFTGEPARQLDERQYDRGFGPCLDAAVSGRTIVLTMDAPDEPYPDFRRVAGDLGVTHTMSLGLPVAAQMVGALNIYDSTGTAFSAEAERIAGTFASFAGIVLANVGVYHDAAELAAQLRAALESRAVIEQAKGIIMAGQRCTGDEAFQVLTRLAQSQERKLRDVAQDVVDQTSNG